jgi:hypothetical protein
VEGIPTPSVVSLNAQAIATAVNEFIIYLSGLRKTNPTTIIDLLGVGRGRKSQWMGSETHNAQNSFIQ